MPANSQTFAYNLQRFVDAQTPVYDRVCEELAAGRKQSHWIWYIFPQMRGLGRSETARYYGLASREEAQAFLEHPILRARLRQCVDLMMFVPARTLSEILAPPDDLKFISSMTLFGEVAAEPEPFVAALDKYAAGKRDDATLALLAKQ